VIARLRGELSAVADDRVICDVRGVGYDVAVPLRLGQAIAAGRHPGEATLHVHTVVREDAIALYGFAHAEDRTCFEQLIGVSQVGPRTALALLGALDAHALARAVNGGDIRSLSAAPGVGKKTAERICLELKGKLHGGTGTAPPPPARVDDPLALALAQLGYKKSEIDAAAAALAAEGLADAPLPARVQGALRVLAGARR
jgi:Holliday junction DNA helicase RuvA